jgi:hypothetical protein
MRWVLPVALVSVVLVGACVPIPMPPLHTPAARRNVPEEIPGWLEPGRTTMADAFFHLGEPDEHTADGRTLGWMSIDRLGGVLLLPLALGVSRLQRLVVPFDGNGVVTDRSVKSVTVTCLSGSDGCPSLKLPAR